MTSAIKITIPQPCTENWELMTPNQQGRHCALCSKTVIDFTKYSDDELIAFFAQQTGDVCGRVKTTQQNRSISPVPISQPTKQRWLPNPLVWVVPMIMGASNSLFSQTTITKKDSLEQTQLNPFKQKQNDTLPTVRGIVIDEATGEGILGAVAMVEDKNFGVVTDDNGRFELKIPYKFLDKEIKLKVSYVGYKDTILKINASNIHTEHKIVLEEKNMELLGEVVYVTKGRISANSYSMPPANHSEPNLNPKKQSIWGRIKGFFSRNKK